MSVNIRFERVGKDKADRPKAKERDGCWITTESGYYRSRFVSWWDLKEIVQNELAFKQAKEAK